jgi:hypothetical protein
MVGQLSDVVVFGVGACLDALKVTFQYNRVMWEGNCEAGKRLACLGVVLLGLW